jgi:outer membrane PBP1 activator LpoA protein
MKSSGLLLVAVILGFVLAACASTAGSDAAAAANKQMEAKGSPFRYRAKSAGEGTVLTMTLLPLPAGPTKANPSLAQQALDAITHQELKAGHSVTSLQEVRYLQDGREVWVLHTLGTGVAYVVAFAAPTQPRSDMKIEGPFNYEK